MYVKYFLCLKHIQTSLLDKYVEMIVQHKTLIQKYICCKMSHCHITTCVDPKGLKVERFKPPLKKNFWLGSGHEQYTISTTVQVFLCLLTCSSVNWCCMVPH